MNDEIFCSVCEDEVNPKRAALGYTTCLNCGAREALTGIREKAQRTGIAYNKGGYQFITPGEDPKTLGRK